MTHRCVTALLAAALVASCGGEPPEPVVRPVRSMVVGDVGGLEARWWPGRAKAAQEVDLAFEVSGQLVQLSVKEGDVVEVGTVMARVDPRDFESALRRTEAERDRAKALLDRVRAAGRAVSAQDRTDAEARYNQALAQVDIQSKAVEDTRIVAPFTGTVAALYYDNFQNVQAKQPVLRFLDVSHLEMVIDIPEDLISLARYVDSVKVRFDAVADVEIPARIAEISNEASRTTRTYPVTLAYDVPDGVDIQPGMAGEATATAKLPADFQARGIEIPAAAIFADEASASDESFVWIVDESSETVSRRAVEMVGLTQQGVVVRGLNPGERVATAGAHYLWEGQRVRIP